MMKAVLNQLAKKDEDRAFAVHLEQVAINPDFDSGIPRKVLASKLQVGAPEYLEALSKTKFGMRPNALKPSRIRKSAAKCLRWCPDSSSQSDRAMVAVGFKPTEPGSGHLRRVAAVELREGRIFASPPDFNRRSATLFSTSHYPWIEIHGDHEAVTL